jgi:hypothetical protein
MVERGAGMALSPVANVITPEVIVKGVVAPYAVGIHPRSNSLPATNEISDGCGITYVNDVEKWGSI